MESFPKRKSIRLEEYDYSQNGAYFVTVCVKDGHELLWELSVGAAFCRPKLSEIGRIAENEIFILSTTYSGVTIDKYVIMPNHIHMIIAVSGDGRQNATPTISRMLNQWKRTISIKIGYSIWQKSFHDHIIRNEDEYQKIWQYIDENPAKWEEDCYYVNG